MSIAAELRSNLELVQEEQPLLPFEEQLTIATDRIIEDLTTLTTRLASALKWEHIDGVNLAFSG